MMREFKFRAWSDETKMMYHSHRPNGTNNPMWSYDSVFRANNPKTHIMQYTGTKDKNGKEIYEGDVVEVEEWREKADETGSHWKWYVYVVSYQDQQWLPDDLDEARIIGNIYENPEMIDKI